MEGKKLIEIQTACQLVTQEIIAKSKRKEPGYMLFKLSWALESVEIYFNDLKRELSKNLLIESSMREHREMHKIIVEHARICVDKLMRFSARA